MSTHIKRHTKKPKYNNNSGLILAIKGNCEEYAEIISSKGDCRFEISLIKDKEKFIAKARKGICYGPNKQKICDGDTVLVEQDSSTTDTKYYIIHKYQHNDIRKLKQMGELNCLKLEKESKQVEVIFNKDETVNNGEVELDDEFISQI